MSGVKRLALADDKGLKRLTNEKLKEEGIAGRDEPETRYNRA